MQSNFKIFLQNKAKYFHKLIKSELSIFWTKRSIINQSGLSTCRNINELPVFNALAAPCNYFLQFESKKLRPILGYLIYKAISSKESKQIDLFLIMPEILHSASLIMDDVEDNARLRRGAPCLHIKYGIDTAVNLSNALYFYPFHKINTSHLQDKIKLRIISILTESMNRIHLGQGIDIYWHNHDINISAAPYQLMARLKTSSFFRAEAKLAALFSNTTPSISNQASDFAEKIGLAFQIMDDVLDLTVDKKKTKEYGKSFAQDIIEGKKTLLIALAIQRATMKDKQNLKRIVNSKSRRRCDAVEAIDILNKYDCIKDAKKHSIMLMKNAWDCFAPKLKNTTYKETLEQYVQLITSRSF